VKIAYVVTATDGAYSDREWWVVRVFGDAAGAEAFVVRLVEGWAAAEVVYREKLKAWEAEWDIRRGTGVNVNAHVADEAWRRKPEFRLSLDANAGSYDLPEYKVEEVQRGKWPIEDEK